MKLSNFARIGLILMVFGLAGMFFSARYNAQETVGGAIDINAAAKYVQQMTDLATKSSDNYKVEISALIDYTLHILRGPKPGGTGYFYASATMDQKDEPETLLSEKVNAVWDAGQQQTFSAEARTVYMIEIYSPKYRTGGVFKNNGDTYIDSYRIEYSIGGKKHTIVSDYKDWVRRNNSVPVVLPGIAEWASIEIVVGVVSADVNHTIVEIRAHHPAIADDPKNPFTYSIEQLNYIQQNVMSMKAEKILERLDDTMKGIQAVPLATAPAATPTDTPADKSVVQKLDYVLYLLNGSPDEQAEGKKELKQLVDSMKQQ
jgi:hypothetical protein